MRSARAQCNEPPELGSAHYRQSGIYRPGYRTLPQSQSECCTEGPEFQEYVPQCPCSLGLGTCCLGGAPAFIAGKPETAELYEALQLSEGYDLLYMIAVGYPDEEPQAKPRDYSKIQFVEYPRL